MKRPKRDPVREDRIHNEAIVDASPDEQAMSWYYYLESKISFPFQAKCLAAKVVSPLRKGETVEVVRMAPDEVCEHDMLVLVRWQGRNMAVPLAQLTAVDPDESTAEAIGDWHYWVAQGYCSLIYARLPKAHQIKASTSPDCIAARVSSAVFSRARSFSSWGRAREFFAKSCVRGIFRATPSFAGLVSVRRSELARFLDTCYSAFCQSAR